MSYQQEAKELILRVKYGMLSTITEDNYPFGSIVPFALTEDLQLIIQVALIAEHYKNIIKNPKSTLLISDPNGITSPMEFSRATCFVTWKEVNSEDRNNIQQVYYNKLGQTIPSEIESGFTYFISKIEKIRWIGGFAKVGWTNIN